MPPYDSKPAGVIRSIRQRWLFGLWDRARAGAEIPHWSKLHTSDLASCFDYLNFIKVFHLNGALQFQILAHGQQIGLMFGKANCDGKFLDEVIPKSGLQSNLESYNKVIQLKTPIFTTSNATSIDGKAVVYERLLLPFSESQGKVTHIIGMLEPMSSEGKFDRSNLFASDMSELLTVRASLKT